MNWRRKDFDTRASQRPIHRSGYVHKPFGIAKDRREWFIYHLPTGMSFNYSQWPSLEKAKLFAEALITKGDWSSKGLVKTPRPFLRACHAVANELGVEHRHMLPVCVMLPPGPKSGPDCVICALESKGLAA